MQGLLGLKRIAPRATTRRKSGSWIDEDGMTEVSMDNDKYEQIIGQHRT